MIALNKDKKEIAFVIGDAPLKLSADSTSVKAWADANIQTHTQVSIIHGHQQIPSGNDVVIRISSCTTHNGILQPSFPWFAIQV